MKLTITGHSTKETLNEWKTLRVNLFGGLQEAVIGRTLDYDVLLAELGTWTEFFEKQPEREKLLAEMQTARAMLWCADVAITHSDSSYPETAERLAAMISTVLPDFIRDKERWALSCIRLFARRGESYRSLRI